MSPIEQPAIVCQSMVEREQPEEQEPEVSDAPEAPEAPEAAEPRDVDADEPSVRMRIVAGVTGLLLLGLVAGYAMLPCPVSYEDRAMLDELEQMTTTIALAPCHLKPGGDPQNIDDLVVDRERAIVLSEAQRAELADILDRDRWLFMGRLTKSDCWEPHHAIVFQEPRVGRFVLQLSMDCGRFKPGGLGPRQMPAIWHWRLTRWLRDVEASASAEVE